MLTYILGTDSWYAKRKVEERMEQFNDEGKNE